MLSYSADAGFVARRHGDLLQPGSTALRLDTGVYHFRTAQDVELRRDPDSAVTVRAVIPAVERDRDQWPDPPPPTAGDGSDDESAEPDVVKDKDKWPDPPPRVVNGFPSDLWADHVVALASKGSGQPDLAPTLTRRRDLGC